MGDVINESMLLSFNFYVKKVKKAIY